MRGPPRYAVGERFSQATRQWNAYDVGERRQPRWLENLVVDVSTDALQLGKTNTQAVLEGRTVQGLFIRGTNSIRIVP